MGQSNNRNSRTYYRLELTRKWFVVSGTYDEVLELEQYDPFLQLVSRKV
jgi:hypothetical protein